MCIASYEEETKTAPLNTTLPYDEVFPDFLNFLETYVSFQNRTYFEECSTP